MTDASPDSPVDSGRRSGASKDVAAPSRGGIRVLLLSVFVVATCGILYELLIGTVSSYFLGSSIQQFSITIGLFLFFMGVGSFISRYVRAGALLPTFIAIELAIGFAGGLSAILLHAAFSFTESYPLLSGALIGVIAGLIGLEIPLVMRIIQTRSTVADAVADVFSFDYVGALLASLAFPLVMLPHLGIMRTSLLVGEANLAIALVNVLYFRRTLRRPARLVVPGLFLMAALGAGFALADRIGSRFEETLYEDQIVFSRQTAYQRLVLTKWKSDFRLYINGNLQFSSRDEKRYHEPLVHVPMLLARDRRTVLVLGGGDGLALREILRYADVARVDLVDLDPAMTALARDNRFLRTLNRASFADPRVTVHTRDAFSFVQESNTAYSVVIIDLPDPNDTGLGKLYSREFYAFVAKRLRPGGIVITQATSPYYAAESFWCIDTTMRTAFPRTVPMHVNVPSFGEWGFIMCGSGFDQAVVSADSADANALATRVADALERQPWHSDLGYLGRPQIAQLFTFSADMPRKKSPVNTLDSQVLTRLYDANCRHWR